MGILGWVVCPAQCLPSGVALLQPCGIRLLRSFPVRKMKSSLVSSPAQARQIREQLKSPEDDLSYELGKAVQELPPLYLQLLAGTISLLTLSAITWATFSQVDEVAVAPGKLVPAVQVRPVRSLTQGMIRAVTVKEGDQVDKGEILIERDVALPQAEIDRLENVAALIRQDLPRLEQEVRERAATRTDLYDQRLNSRQQEYGQLQAGAIAEANRQAAAIDAAKIQLARLQANLVNAKKNLANARENLSNAQIQERALRTLADAKNGAVPRLAYVEAQDKVVSARDNVVSISDKVVSLESDIAVQQQEINQATQAYQAAQTAVARVQSENQSQVLELESEHQNETLARSGDRSEILTQLNQRREELTTVAGQLAAVRKQRDLEMVKAPVAGIIYRVEATRGPVQPGEELLSILPQGEELLLEVNVLNQDVGFVSKGMRAKVKLAAFPFQEFGTVDGSVVQISPNAIVDKDLGLVFPTKVRLKKTSIKTLNREVKLVPGMAATGEIVTRKKSILTFLIEPITRRFSQAFSVR